MVVGDEPNDWLYMVWRRTVRCFALLSIYLMCALNDSDESKVAPINLALLCIGMFALLMVMCVVGFSEVRHLQGKNICPSWRHLVLFCKCHCML